MGLEPMKLASWLPLYDQICLEFGYDKHKDIANALALASMLGARSRECLDELKVTFPASVLVCGGGETLADELSSSTYEGFVVVADSATTVVRDNSIVPDVIVTDLDGIVEDQIEQNADGCTVFVHAHGDNGPALAKYVKSFSGPVVGTCQCPPPQGLYNFGGFTDGDRAVCISAELGAKTIILAGFDFERPSSKGGKDPSVKIRKLRWARRIIDIIAADGVRVMPLSQSIE